MTELITTDEAARMLGLTPGTLTSWRSTRAYSLRYVKVGRKVRYRTADLEAFLQARTVSGTNEAPEEPTRAGRRSRAGRKLTDGKQREADGLDNETDLLLKAGYFDANGNPRKGVEGKRIWEEVQAKLRRKQN